MIKQSFRRLCTPICAYNFALSDSKSHTYHTLGTQPWQWVVQLSDVMAAAGFFGSSHRPPNEYLAVCVLGGVGLYGDTSAQPRFATEPSDGAFPIPPRILTAPGCRENIQK